MARKPKSNQPKTPNTLQGRDLFQTPNYAVDLLVPFIPKNIPTIWECAAGKRKIADRLDYHKVGTFLYCTDLMGDLNNLVFEHNFLDDAPELIQAKIQQDLKFCIITNPPFSLKENFYRKCLEYRIPFALLLPFDMCYWMAEAFGKDGIQALVPNRRIDYITPTGLSGATGHTSYYHSFWLTWGFNLPEQVTVVELTNKEKKENI